MSIVCKKWVPISRRALDSIANKCEESILGKLIKKLNDVQYISLTVDIWTDRRLSSFLGVTAHYIDEKFNFNTCLLCCKHILSSTGVHIKNELDLLLDSFNIK